MNRIHTRLWSFTLAVAMLSGCGGGGDAGASPAAGPGPSPAPSPVAAPSPTPANPTTGAPNSPNPLRLDTANSIGVDTFFNNFSYTAEAGERLVVRVILSSPLTLAELNRCASNSGTGSTPSTYTTQIHVYNAAAVREAGICGESLTVQLATAGIYRLNFEFPGQGGGSVNVASLRGPTPVTFTTHGDGSPTRPKPLNTSAGNAILANPFLNHYWVRAQQGETVVLSANLAAPLNQQERTRCAAGAESGYNTQLRIFNATLSPVTVVCGDSTNFVAPAAGEYVIQVDYGIRQGVLNAAKL